MLELATTELTMGGGFSDERRLHGGKVRGKAPRDLWGGGSVGDGSAT